MPHSAPSNWSAADIPDLSGKTAIVTGANSGIGLETARELARKGASVVLGCRNEQKGAAAVDDIRKADSSARIELESLNLADLASVEEFARNFTASHERLDILCNNGGVMVPPLGWTQDGFETQFGTNHLGHFALTGRLLAKLLAAPNARIVNVSSTAHRTGKIHFDNLDGKKSYNAIAFYGQSKLANLLFTRELQKRLQGSGANALAAAAHPGWTATNLQDNAPLVRMLNPLLSQSPPDGALPTLYAATADGVEGGGYYGPSRMFEMWGSPKPAVKSARAQDDEVAARLWSLSEELTGVSFAL
jgi:NAD(P)-dependent dehydrogenase (short-subunit alcohol dehydrogenase family)